MNDTLHRECRERARERQIENIIYKRSALCLLLLLQLDETRKKQFTIKEKITGENIQRKNSLYRGITIGRLIYIYTPRYVHVVHQIRACMKKSSSGSPNVEQVKDWYYRRTTGAAEDENKVSEIVLE